jgi:CBS domain-containing protein
VNIAESLAAMPVADMDLSRYVEVPADATIAEAVRTMNAAGRSIACIIADGWLVGVFTQRDIMMRVIGRRRVWEHPVVEEMTRSVRTVKVEQSAADGLAIMNDWWVRNVPVLDGDDRLAGNLSYYTVMDTIAGLIQEHLSDPNLKPEVRHSLTLIDFTGLHTSPAVTVEQSEAVEVAAHHMRARAIGSVLVVDGHHNLVGVLTEFDLQTKIGCEHDDLTNIAVKDIMTPEPISLAMRAPIADAITKMAERGFSHLPLLGESGRPVAVASFRDIAAYIETSLVALG